MSKQYETSSVKKLVFKAKAIECAYDAITSRAGYYEIDAIDYKERHFERAAQEKNYDINNCHLYKSYIDYIAAAEVFNNVAESLLKL
jgi:hypothetical protein